MDGERGERACFSCGNPSISAIGDDANLFADIIGKGAGGGRLRTGGGVNQIQWSSVGVGFFGTAATAKQSITGALSTVTDAAAKAVLTSIISALSTPPPGLATNGTT